MLKGFRVRLLLGLMRTISSDLYALDAKTLYTNTLARFIYRGSETPVGDCYETLWPENPIAEVNSEPTTSPSDRPILRSWVLWRAFHPTRFDSCDDAESMAIAAANSVRLADSRH